MKYWIINNGKYGFYFRVNDPTDCAKMIYNIISDYNNKKLLEQVMNAYKHTKENFDVRKTAERYIKKYEK